MSLDLYLRYPNRPTVNYASEEIYVRRDGENVSISREEWDRLHPGREPVRRLSNGEEQGYEEVFHGNITHNLGKMASEAGLYDALWRPYRMLLDWETSKEKFKQEPAEEYEFECTHPVKAIEIIAPLAAGIKALLSRPEHFQTFNPDNGWGTYEGLLRFVRSVLNACLEHPQAIVLADR